VSREIADGHDTLVALLDGSRRGALPLRRSFVQTKAAGGRASAGVLAPFVAAHHERALDQYLLFHAAASGGDYGVARPAKVWARALSFGAGASAVAAVSKNWAWLETQGLLARGRYGRLSKPVLLREDGSGKPYTHPSKTGESYFKVPHAFWLDDWHRRLGLAEKAVLLIALSLQDDFILPVEHASGWYGLSADTLNRGLVGLRRRDALEVRRQRRKAPLAPEGYTWEFRYRLRPPFGPRGRSQQGAA
jgi:hypothetical protein